MHQPLHPASLDRAPIPFGEFVAMAAALMALTALGIDSMLPALPAIGDSLGVAAANDRQYVITAFLIGFAIAQLAHGPLADRFGRRPVLGCALLFGVAMNLLAAVSDSFGLLLFARFSAGMAIAGARVVTVAMVRDCFAGRAMARVMSLVFVVFMAAPVLAPAFGQIVLLFAPWRWIFVGNAVVAAAILVWFWLRMPETLAPDARSPISIERLAYGARMFARDRCAVGYTVAAALLSGGLFGFINSIQQIMADIFGRGELLTIVFASVAGTMAIANFLNSRIVMRLGTRLISHSALAGFVVLACVHLAVSASGAENLAVFIILQALLMACFGLATSNFSAMAMENMGAIAGRASSLQGFIQTLAGALIGAVIGQAFDGTTVPLYTGFVVTGFAALAVVAVAERGRMFRPR
ncbi:multidrug effflux MFS transporter [Sphingomonas baiyangensis]|uniref:Multidrug effflux MFS transporter n=1 Tax=Sphingomonas baiyangensis TaxID=2572576 RepID=A0A4U1L9C4_9SPHN|nr:multidrug effflux MFS transporter [Sphingomonas baiyangensis]TKD52916.1 multidrug effflux MFS transporter [Sphingomonas baiyangensis]